MDALKAMIGLARERLTQASRALPRLRPPAAKAASLSDHQRNIAAPAEAGENEEGAAEDGHKAAWFRRKGRDEAEDLARLGAKARHQARVEREEAQRSVADADQRLQAVLGRSQANAGRAESVTCWPPQRRDSDDQGMAPMSINPGRKFDEAMFNIYRRAKEEAHYTATIFLRMLTERGGLNTAKYLINSPKPSDGYTALYERQRLDLTVEAMVIEEPAWHTLFTQEELDRAKRRLAEYGYKPLGHGM